VPEPEHITGELEDLADGLVACERLEEARSGLALVKLKTADCCPGEQEQICHGQSPPDNDVRRGLTQSSPASADSPGGMMRAGS
jgi:hypothetical protein